jgi:hypothetical protein
VGHTHAANIVGSGGSRLPGVEKNGLQKQKVVKNPTSRATLSQIFLSINYEGESF